MLTIRYYDRKTKTTKERRINDDVIEIQIPAQEGQRALNINVNTDAVIVDTQYGQRVAMYEFTDMLADASDDLDNE